MSGKLRNPQWGTAPSMFIPGTVPAPRDEPRTLGLVEYDEQERWLIEIDGDGASRIIARDVSRFHAAAIVAALIESEARATATPSSLPAASTTIPRSHTTGTPGTADPRSTGTGQPSSPPAADTSDIGGGSRSSQVPLTPDGAGSASSSYLSVSGRYTEARATATPGLDVDDDRGGEWIATPDGPPIGTCWNCGATDPLVIDFLDAAAMSRATATPGLPSVTALANALHDVDDDVQFIRRDARNFPVLAGRLHAALSASGADR